MRALVGLLLLATACSSARPGPTPTAVPTPINMDDMMGGVVQQTVFVAANGRVSAVTLLNHYTRYTIATQGLAQVSSNRGAQLLYLLQPDEPGSWRLRRFDVATGRELAIRTGITHVASDRQAMAVANDGRVLVLKSDVRRAWVDAYEVLTLEPLSVALEKPGCGDRLLVSDGRVAIVCRATGEVQMVDRFGQQTASETGMRNLVATAIEDTGGVYVATADGQLAVVPPRPNTVVPLTWPQQWTGAILPDGMAVANETGYLLVLQRADDGTWLRGKPTWSAGQYKSFRLAGVPHGGILELWPFAYYAVDRTIRHVDLNTGLLETMADVGDDARAGAVVNG